MRVQMWKLQLHPMYMVMTKRVNIAVPLNVRGGGAMRNDARQAVMGLQGSIDIAGV